MTEPTTHTRMDIGGYTSWRCLGCPNNGNHPKAPPAQVHANLTGHNVQVTETQIHLVYPAGQAPIPVETRPAATPFSVPPEYLTYEREDLATTPRPPAGPSPLTMATQRARTTP